jgi:hypothetical protein
MFLDYFFHVKNCGKTGKLEISGKVLGITGEP